MAVTVSRSRLILILIIIFTAVVAGAVVLTAVLLQGGTGGTPSKAALCSNAGTSGNAQQYNDPYVASCDAGNVCYSGTSASEQGKWICIKQSDGFYSACADRNNTDPTGKELKEASKSGTGRVGVFCNSFQCGGLNEPFECVNNGNGCVRKDTISGDNGHYCGNNVCSGSNTACNSSDQCADPSSAACIGTTTALATTTPVVTTTTGGPAASCGGNVCAPNSVCNPNQPGECLPPCDRTKTRCSCQGNPCLGSSGTTGFTCGSNGATCTPNTNGWEHLEKSCRFSTSSGSLFPCAPSTFTSCNPGIGQVCECSANCVTGTDGYTYCQSTLGTASAANCNTSCTNTDGTPKYGIQNGPVCNNPYRCANAPVTTTPVPTTTVAGAKTCYYCAQAAPTGQTPLCSQNDNIPITAPCDSIPGGIGLPGYDSKLACESSSLCHYAPTPTPTIITTTTPPPTTTTRPPTTTTPPITTTQTTGPTTPPITTTTTSSTTTTTTTTTTSTGPTTTVPPAAYTCDSISVTKNGTAYDGTTGVTTGDVIGFTINGSSNTTGTGYNLNVDSVGAANGTAAGSSGAYTYNVGGTGNLYSILGYATANGVTYRSAACIFNFFRTGVTPPSLTILKTSTPTTVAPGGKFNVTLQVTNNGGSATSVYTLTDSLPAGFTYADSATLTAPGGISAISATGTTGDIVFTLNTSTGVSLAAGESLTVTFKVTAPSATQCMTYVNVATISNPGGGSSQSNMGVCNLPNTGALEDVVYSVALGAGFVAVSYTLYRYNLIARLIRAFNSRK